MREEGGVGGKNIPALLASIVKTLRPLTEEMSGKGLLKNKVNSQGVTMMYEVK